MQGLFRLLKLFAIVIWVGGLVFFAFVLAPTAFHTLPSIHLAGEVVGSSLKVFNVLALACGAVLLISTGVLSRSRGARQRKRLELEFLLAGAMLVGTAYIHWNIVPSMDADMAALGGDTSKADPANPAKLHFDKLHMLSERMEGGVMLVGFVVLFLMSREGTSTDS